MNPQNKPLAATIASYRNDPQPHSNHLQNLAALAVRLAELKQESWSLADEICDHYVYVYTDPRKPKGRYVYTCPSGKRVTFPYPPIYVGKGKANRLDVHLTPSSLEVKSGKNNILKAIIEAGFDPRDYRHKTSKQTDWMACALEIDLIAGIGRLNDKTGPLTNGTLGGEGTSGLRHSKESRLLIGQASVGRLPTEDSKSRMSLIAKGRKKSAEHRRSLSKSQLGRSHSAETRAKMSASHRGQPSALKGRPWSEARRAAHAAKIGLC